MSLAQDSAVLTVNRSFSRTYMLASGSFLFTLAGAAIAFRWLPVAYGSFTHFVGWAGLLFFGAITPLWIRGITDSRSVLEIGPDGMLDRRASPQIISWADIAAINVFAMRGTKMLTLRLTPGARERLPQTRVRRLIDSVMGFGDLFVSTEGLDAEFAPVVERWMQATNRAPADAEIEGLKKAIYS